jgi:hypothetical protein
VRDDGAVSERWDRPEVVATFGHAWEAEVARSYLNDVGIDAWVEASAFDDPYRTFAHGGSGVRLFARHSVIQEAREVLEEARAESFRSSPVEQEADRVLTARVHRRPVWVVIAATLVLVTLAITAVPANLRIPVLALAPAAYLVWRILRPGPER